MVSVLVTGGTGSLGRRLVPELLRRGHDVRVLSRSLAPKVADGATTVQGNVLTGEGLDHAVSGASAVVHAATNPTWRTRATEVDGTRQLLLAAERHAVAHVLYVSIVGVDRIRFPYYKAKWAAEQLVERSTVPWTIQRITQFHDLLNQFLGFRVFPRTSGLRFQPIDVGEAASRLADLVDSGPQGRAADIGGPEALSIRELRDTRRAVTGRRTLLVPAPKVGALKDFDAGHHLVPGDPHGEKTWTTWLSESG